MNDLTTQLKEWIFDGRSLASWLEQLVSRSPESRKPAASIVTEARLSRTAAELPAAHSVADASDCFAAQIKAALCQPGFRATEFTRDLLQLHLALHASWMATCQTNRARQKRCDDELDKKLGDNPSPADQRRYAKRLVVGTCREMREIANEEPHEVFTTGAAVTWVIGALDKELLPATDLLQAMMSDKRHLRIATEAIARMGEAGIKFYAELVAGFTLDEPNRYRARAIGALLRACPQYVTEIFSLLNHSNTVLRVNAASALAAAGRVTLCPFPEAERKLLALAQASNDEAWFSYVGALREIGITNDTVTLLLAATHPADGERVPTAISALAGVARAPELVVPRLIELLDEFEESDESWSRGEHERIVDALRRFGPAANAAIPALIRHIWTEPQEYYDQSQKLRERREPDEAVIKFLGELGRGAAAAQSSLYDIKGEILRRIREEQTEEPTLTSSDSQPTDFRIDYIEEAIRRVQ